jgi:hypothetical protein
MVRYGCLATVTDWRTDELRALGTRALTKSTR